MRIAMIGPFGWRPKGTVQVRAFPLARALAARGHAVKIVMPPWHTPEDAGRVWAEEGVGMEYVTLGPRVPVLGHLVTVYRLVRAVVAWRPEVVHCFKPKAYSGLAAMVLWGTRWLWRRGIRLVMDEDDWEGAGGWNDLEPYPHLWRSLFSWQERWGLKHSDAVTAASRTLQSLTWSLGIPSGRVYYLPNGVTLDPGRGDASRVSCLSSQAGPVVLLYTRFFEFDVARAVAVFRGIADQIPSARFLVVGQALFPLDDARFDRLVREAGLEGAVVRTGWVPQERLPDHFARATLAIYPFDDTLVNRAKCPVKLVDLLGAGLSVVADAVGQNCEYIVHRETGWLVPPGDVTAMVAATLQLLGDSALRQRLGDGAKARMAVHYAWPVLAAVALRAYTAADRVDGHSKAYPILKKPAASVDHTRD